MDQIKQLKVNISIGGKEIEVGELVYDGRNIYFKYYPSFIATGLEISPFKLPLSDQIRKVDTPVFEGLFGVFHDSLPDGWGRLLLDRTLLSKGVSLNQITALDRLSFVGRTGAGALVYQPGMDSDIDFEKQLELDSIFKAAQNVYEGTSYDVLEELWHLGGSSGGARPKILVEWNAKNDQLVSDAINFKEGFEPWIIKFPTIEDFSDIANIEFAYYKMALDAGLEMSSCKLFHGKSGKAFFGTKRFDREGDQRLHLHSAAGLLHDNFRLSTMDYGHLMDAAFRLENHVKAYEKVLRLASFNVFAHNRDDHSKNVSFLMNAKGDWYLAPAYDLTFSYSGHGFHSTTVAGEGKNPGSAHLSELANDFGVKNISDIIEQTKEVISNWKKYAKENGVGKNSTQLIEKTLQELLVE